MFHSILLPLDQSTLAECALPHAVAIARSFGSQISLLHVLEQYPGFGQTLPVDPVEWSIRKAEAAAYLDKVAGRLKEIGLPVEEQVLEGSPAERIIDFAHSRHVDLIVLSSHGKNGISAWDVSSVVNKILYRTHASTLLIRAYQAAADLNELRYRHIMLPLDGSQRAEHAMGIAVELARRNGGGLRIIHVVERPRRPSQAPPTREDVELENRIVERNRTEATRYLEELSRRLEVESTFDVIVGGPVAARLHELSSENDVDLLVLTAHGESGLAKWRYGGVTTSFLAYGKLPILVVQDLGPQEIQPTYAELAAQQHKGH
jgi:nucleotide-binding universal stress UspA family protein